MGQLPPSGKRELMCLLLFTCNYMVSVGRAFLFLWVLGMGYVILLWHSMSLPYNFMDLKFVLKISRKLLKLRAWSAISVDEKKTWGRLFEIIDVVS